MRFSIPIVLLSTLPLIPLQAQAVSTEDTLSNYEKRIQVLEQQIQNLKQPSADSPQQTKQIKKLKKKNKRLNSKMNKLTDHMRNQADKIKINGFFTAGVTRSDSDAKLADKEISNDIKFQPDSVLGIQFQFKIDDASDIVTQLVARGNDKQNASIEWAYYRYQFADFTFRAGRLRVPFFLLSEYQDVGLALPWARAPIEAYGAAPFDNFEGTDLSWNYGTDSLSGRISIYSGRSNDTNTPISDLSINDIVGINATLDLGDFSFRIGAAQAKITSDTFAGMGANLASMGITQSFSRQVHGDFGGVSLRYDNGSLLVIGEAIQNHRGEFLSDTRGNYITTGYRIAMFMPYVSYGKRYTSDNAQRNTAITNLKSKLGGTSDVAINQLIGVLSSTGIGNLEEKSWTFGLRMNFTPSIAMKTEFQHLYDFGDTNGPFTSDPGDNVDIYSLVLNTTF